MAFNIFPKSPAKAKAQEAKKPGPEIAPRHDARTPARAGSAAATSAREVAAAAKARPAGTPASPLRQAEVPREREITVTGPPSMIEWGPAQEQNILVAEANPGLCAVLEDAALRYANGHAQAARETLEQGIANDDDARVSPLASFLTVIFAPGTRASV